MAFRLSAQNVFDYLEERGIDLNCDRSLIQVELKFAKNFNLLLSFPEGRKLLVKQEPYKPDGQTVGEFYIEQRVHNFIEQFSDLSALRAWLPEWLDFDPENSIIILNYLTEYRDFSDFYVENTSFPPELAASLGYILGSFHKSTFNRADYRRFWITEEQELAAQQSMMLAKGLERIGPEIFGEFPAEALKFFALYQRYESLGQAIAELSQSVQLSCLIHNDLKLNNVLLHQTWEDLAVETGQPAPIRLIDWERCNWGDPALDLGTLVASYLQIWLNSMVVSSSLDIQESLRLATIPLEKLQPSTVALIEAYLNRFPEVLSDRPDFVKRVVQYTGLMLIHQINAFIQYQKTFNNTGICMLQVAKSLLCRPEASIQSIFGVPESRLVPMAASSGLQS